MVRGQIAQDAAVTVAMIVVIVGMLYLAFAGFYVELEPILLALALCVP
jgi:hypothetical protein